MIVYIHYMPTIRESARELLGQCVCARVRTAARLVTRAYDDMLRPAGIEASQLAVLAAVASDEMASIAALSKVLCMDRTTLSRNLRPLIAQKLVTLTETGTGRSRSARITRTGEAKLKAAVPHWRKAQLALTEQAGAHHLAALNAQLLQLISSY